MNFWLGLEVEGASTACPEVLAGLCRRKFRKNFCMERVVRDGKGLPREL